MKKSKCCNSEVILFDSKIMQYKCLSCLNFLGNNGIREE